MMRNLTAEHLEMMDTFALRDEVWRSSQQLSAESAFSEGTCRRLADELHNRGFLLRRELSRPSGTVAVWQFSDFGRVLAEKLHMVEENDIIEELQK